MLGALTVQISLFLRRWMSEPTTQLSIIATIGKKVDKPIAPKRSNWQVIETGAGLRCGWTTTGFVSLIGGIPRPLY